MRVQPSLANLQDHFPIKNHLAYFNNAATGAMSSDCLEAIKSTLDRMALNGIDFELYNELKETANVSRQRMAELLDAKPEGFLFTESTTQSINLLAKSLSIKKGDTIITRGGASEHPANYVPWMYYAKRNGADVVDVPVDRNGLPDLSEFDSILTKAHRPRLVVLGHVIYNLGIILPVSELSRIAHEHGSLVFLDIAQSAGSLPFSLEEVGCDFAAGTAAKWICGPFGLGFFYFRREALENLEDTDYLRDMPQLDLDEAYDSAEMPLFYFRNYAYVAGLLPALSLLLRLGMQKIRSRNQNLTRALIEGLAPLSNRYRVVGDFDDEIRASIVALEPLMNNNAGSVVKELLGKGIAVAQREVNGKKIIRVSPHFYNDESEISKLVGELANIA